MSRRGTNARIALSLVGQFNNQKAGLDVRTRGADHSGSIGRGTRNVQQKDDRARGYSVCSASSQETGRNKAVGGIEDLGEPELTRARDKYRDRKQGIEKTRE